ncbi:hypothetical protein JHK87_033657 [Glycine soja]|nr:hypothetical protein JHK87_033657 [Glycine soja]
MDEFHYEWSNSEEPRVQRDLKEIAETKDLEENARLAPKKQELQLLKENIKEHFETSSNSSLSVAEMAKKIDELVNKVISLETAISSQTVMVTRLKTDTDELQEQIQTLENDKESLIKDKNKLNEQLRKMEEKMHGNNNLQTQFNEAHNNLDQLSEKVQNVQQPGEEAKTTDLSHTQKDSSSQVELKSKSEGQVPLNEDNILLNDIKSENELTNGLVEDDAKDKELKVAGTVEDDVTSDNKLEATSSPFANEPKVTRSLENDAKSVDKVKVTSSLDMEEATPMEKKISKRVGRTREDCKSWQ